MNTETLTYGPFFRSTRIGISDSSCCLEGTWYVVVRQRFDLEREVMIRSSVPLVRYHDPDDARRLRGRRHGLWGV